MTYYDKEMAQLGAQGACLKLQNDHGQTRWLDVTPEQLEAILAILNGREYILIGANTLEDTHANL